MSTVDEKFNVDHVVQDLDLDLPEAPDMQRIMAIIEREAQNRAQAAHQHQKAVVSGQAAELQPLGANNPLHADDAISEKNLDVGDEAESGPPHAFEGNDANEGSSGVVPTVVLQ